MNQETSCKQTSVRTDLACERLDLAGDIAPEGVKKETAQREGITITSVTVETEKGANLLGKPVGRYITLDISSLKGYTDNFQGEVSVVAEEIRKLLPEEGLILVVGLGNSDITPDALGPLAINKTLATRHFKGELAQQTGLENLRAVAAVAPGVLGQTGMESAEMISCICEQIKPAAVIAIDALASRSIDRLAATIQLSDTGISPGSGVQNARKELSASTLGVPVIALGVPTVVDMTTIAYELLGEGETSEKVSDRGRAMMVTPREIDNVIKQSAKTVAAAVNMALQPMLSFEELEGLTA